MVKFFYEYWIDKYLVFLGKDVKYIYFVKLFKCVSFYFGCNNI